MGKSCVRFKDVDDIPLALIGDAVARTSVDEFIAHYEKIIPASVKKKRAAKKKAGAKKAAKKKAVKRKAAKRKAAKKRVTRKKAATKRRAAARR